MTDEIQAIIDDYILGINESDVKEKDPIKKLANAYMKQTIPVIVRWMENATNDRRTIEEVANAMLMAHSRTLTLLFNHSVPLNRELEDVLIDCSLKSFEVYLRHDIAVMRKLAEQNAKAAE